jgi:hypothetical protein
MRHFSALLAALLIAAPASATVLLSSTLYSQDFDSLANTGTSSTLPGGWAIAEAGTNANTSYGVSSGTSETGNTYSFGAEGSSERALGGLASASLLPSFGVGFTNALAGSITALQISYFGELWRVGAAANSNVLSFAYSTDATSLTSGNYTGFATLNYVVSPTGFTSRAGVNGNTNRTAISGTIDGLSIAPGDSIFLRWSAIDAPGFDHSMGIDDFQLVASFTAPQPPVFGGSAVPEPETWALLIAGFGLVGSLQRRQRSRGKIVLC